MRHSPTRLPALALAGALAIAAAASVARAGDGGLQLPPAGHTLVNLSASERTTLPQDLLTAALRIEARGAEPRKVQDDINKAMTKALALAKAVPTVKTSTGGYQVYEQRLERNVRVWQGQQTVQLESKDSAALLDLAGKLQGAGFAVSGLNWSLSPERAESVRDELLVKALGNLKTKAALVARTLGKSGYELTDVNLDGAPQPVPVYRAVRMEMAMAADGAVAAPVAEAGETEVVVGVSARALLKP
jgi:predicted secreted protein